jgi:hypothetical protein
MIVCQVIRKEVMVKLTLQPHIEGSASRFCRISNGNISDTHWTGQCLSQNVSDPYGGKKTPCFYQKSNPGCMLSLFTDYRR